MQLDERPGGAPESEDIEDMMRGGVGVQRQVRSPPHYRRILRGAGWGPPNAAAFPGARCSAPPRASGPRATDPSSSLGLALPRLIPRLAPVLTP